MSGYIKLGDDLDRIIGGYDDNPGITAGQKATWFKQGKLKAVTHGMLGHDHPKALRLNHTHGCETVGSLRSNTARRFWDYGEGHVFPPQEDLLRFGLFFQLDIYRVLALVLKGAWEIHFAYGTKSWRPNRGVQILDVMLDAEDQEIREAQLLFKPNSGELFRLFEKFGFLAGDEACTERSFETLIQEMILSDMHRVGINSREMEGFIERKREEQRLLKGGTPEEQQAFLAVKCRWLERQEELGDLFLRIEETRLRNAEVTRRWLAVFGAEELELREQVLRYERLDARYACKLAHPDFNRAEIEECMREKEASEQRALRRLAFDVALAPHLDMGNTNDNPECIEDALVYRNHCKKILRRIYSLTHPDHLEHVEAYRKMAPERQEELREILVQTFQMRDHEDETAGLSIFLNGGFLERLQGVLNRVEALLEYPDIETDVNKIIRGGTLPEQLDWLKQEVDRLENEIDLARARLHAFLEGDDILQKRALLENPERHPRIKDELKAGAGRYRERADFLERELEELLSGEAKTENDDAV